MTDIAALDRLIEAVEAGRKCVIPSPRRPIDMTARIMGYVEGYAVMRHSGCMPFVVAAKDVISHLHDCKRRHNAVQSIIRAHRAQIGGQ